MANDLIYAGADNDSISGGSGLDTIYGEAGNDTLNGGTNADMLIGGTGDDLYILDNAGDVVTESAGEGTDTVQTGSISYTLGANVENLTLTGSPGIHGTGNSLDNIIVGNNGSNTLTGNDGNDTISGGSGSDKLFGNNGNDTLDGGTGTDTMTGGAGDDVFVVDSLLDVVNESAAEGTDTVQSSVSYTLGLNVENLTLIGSSAISGTGNTGNNVITGNSGTNVLNGGDGNDTVKGGSGSDTIHGGNNNDFIWGEDGLDNLYGDAGADIFVFEAVNAYNNVDVIKDFSTGQSDAIDINNLLTEYDPLTEALADFVEITTIGSDSVLKVDRDGTGSTYSFVQIATIEGVTGLTDEAALVASGNLIVA